MQNRRTYNVFELFFRKNGEKRSILCNSRNEVSRRRSVLRRNKRKFLGVRELSLIEA
jgi:hypothetical protein